MNRKLIKAAALGLAAGASLFPAVAQDSGPLIDKLVQKGILTDQEAEDVRADLVKDFNQTSAGKLSISNSITELKLYGDARYRYQYDDQQSQIQNDANVSQRSRHRFRLRVFADAKFSDNFFGGFGLETAKPNDSGMQTVDPVYSDSNIYISKVFLGYNAGDWGTVVLGKQKNPFYSTELLWDTDINPFGLTESIAFHKLFAYEESYAPSQGYDKDGKTVAAPAGVSTSSGFDWGKFELTFVAGQFIYNTDNTTISSTNEAEFDNDASSDVYMFQQQLVATYNFDAKTALTIAPSFIFYNAGDIQDLTATENAQGFGDVGVTPQGTSIPSSGIVPRFSGESRDLAILDLAGEFKFPLGSFNAKLSWDVAYNLNGEDRYRDVYGLGYTVTKLNTGGTDVVRDLVGNAVQYDPVTGTQVADDYTPRQHRTQDNLAWLVGFEIGQGKGKGAWSLATTYRETGIASVDPNLNDSDFGLSRLNLRGFKTTGTYWLSDFVSIAATAQIAYNIEDDLFGGQATSGDSLADRNSVNVYQFDVNWKF